jgi:hypothetical protein
MSSAERSSFRATVKCTEGGWLPLAIEPDGPSSFPRRTHMQMFYNSENFAVVQIEVAGDASVNGEAPAPGDRGGYEIVDKFARKEIYLQGALAHSFRVGVEALIQGEPSEEDIDEYIEGFASLMRQALVLH